MRKEKKNILKVRVAAKEIAAFDNADQMILINVMFLEIDLSMNIFGSSS